MAEMSYGISVFGVESSQPDKILRIKNIIYSSHHISALVSVSQEVKPDPNNLEAVTSFYYMCLNLLV